MPKLKSRDQFPPGGFQFLIPETGMKKPIEGSFMSVVNEVIKIRRANPFLTEKYAWRSDWDGVSAEVEQYNVARCLAHGWTDWLVDDVATPPPPYDPVKKNRVGVAGGVKAVAAGVAILVEWLGTSGKPVTSELAEARAAVCAACPLNGKGGLLDYFTAAAAEGIRIQVEMRNDLRLQTSNDGKLGTCEACMCHLPLKVFVPLEHIWPRTTQEVRSKLDKSCWILSEGKAMPR